MHEDGPEIDVHNTADLMEARRRGAKFNRGSPLPSLRSPPLNFSVGHARLISAADRRAERAAETADLWRSGGGGGSGVAQFSRPPPPPSDKLHKCHSQLLGGERGEVVVVVAGGLGLVRAPAAVMHSGCFPSLKRFIFHSPADVFIAFLFFFLFFFVIYKIKSLLSVHLFPASGSRK